MTKTGRKIAEIRGIFCEEELAKQTEYLIKDDARIYLKFIGDPNPDQQEFPLGFYSSEQLLTDKIEDELLDVDPLKGKGTKELPSINQAPAFSNINNNLSEFDDLF